MSASHSCNLNDRHPDSGEGARWDFERELPDQ
jgi:hypothetical protein